MITKQNVSRARYIRHWIAGAGVAASLGGCEFFVDAFGEGQFCSDGVDNDENGLIDCADPVCKLDPVCIELDLFCGNGVLDFRGELELDGTMNFSLNEECDDGNTNDQDGCNAQCKQEPTSFVDCDAGQAGDGSEDNPFQTIQEAIEAVSAGGIGRIVVEGTTCNGGILIRQQKQIVLQARGKVTIDTQGFDLVITEQSTAVIQDFILRANQVLGAPGGRSSGSFRVENASKVAFLSVNAQNSGNTPNGGVIESITISSLDLGSVVLVDSSVIQGTPGGGGVVVDNNSLGLVTNSIIKENGTLDTSLFGALHNVDNSFSFSVGVTFANNILGENSALDPDDSSAIDCRSGQTTRIENSIFLGDTNRLISPNCTVNFSDALNFTPTIGSGNSTEDPLFVDNANDFRLRSGSPAIDTGNGLLTEGDFFFNPDTFFQPLVGRLNVLGHDIEGKPRPLGNGFDMGAFEDF